MTLWQAVDHLHEHRVAVPDEVPLRLLRRMASLGFASQCGRLFHVTPMCDRAAVAIRAPIQKRQLELHL